MMIALAFNVIGMNLVIMDVPAGVATSILVGWCIFYSYTRSVCVYHRFKTSHYEENFLRDEIGKDFPQGGCNFAKKPKKTTKRLMGTVFLESALRKNTPRHSIGGMEFILFLCT